MERGPRFRMYEGRFSVEDFPATGRATAERVRRGDGRGKDQSQALVPGTLLDATAQDRVKDRIPLRIARSFHERLKTDQQSQRMKYKLRVVADAHQDKPN